DNAPGSEPPRQRAALSSKRDGAHTPVERRKQTPGVRHRFMTGLCPCSLNPCRALVPAVLMQDGPDRSTLAIDLHADLGVHGLQEELAVARCEDLNRRLSRKLHKQVRVV